MAEEKAAAPAAPAAEGQAASGKSPLVLILLLVNSIGLVAVAVMQYQSHQIKMHEPSVTDVVKAELAKAQKEEKESSSEESLIAPKRPDQGQLLTLDPFTANLAQGDGPRRFVRLNAVLKFSLESKPEEFEQRKPQIRDTIISILNSKRPEDLLATEGKSYLKEEIKGAINSFLIDGKVIDIFYVGFQIN